MFDSNRGVITTFPGILVSNWTKALNTWNTTRDSEDAGRRKDTTEKARITQTPLLPVKLEQTDLDTMALVTINLEEVGMDEGLTIYENMW